MRSNHLVNECCCNAEYWKTPEKLTNLSNDESFTSLEIYFLKINNGLVNISLLSMTINSNQGAAINV